MATDRQAAFNVKSPRRVLIEINRTTSEFSGNKCKTKNARIEPDFDSTQLPEMSAFLPEMHRSQANPIQPHLNPIRIHQQPAPSDRRG